MKMMWTCGEDQNVRADVVCYQSFMAAWTDRRAWLLNLLLFQALRAWAQVDGF